MPTYDATRFNPPAPMVQVGLRYPDTGTVQSDVPMLLDTGADVTLVPQTVVDLLQVAVIPGIQYELMGFDGDARFVPAVRLELVFPHCCP
jgi:predicted aspartyl protease